MNPWRTLGIDPTSDQRAIKRAYAVRLKRTRPDEDPEGFKQLHAAYQWATDYARAQAFDPASEPPQNPADASDDFQPLPIQRAVSDESSQEAECLPQDIPSDPSWQAASDRAGTADPDHQALEALLDTDPQAEQAYLQREWERLTEAGDRATASLENLNNPTSWDFLDNRQALFDLQLKSEFSLYLFSRIASLLPDRKGKAVIQPAIFDRLDGIFRWQDSRDLLEEELGYAEVDLLFQSIKVHAPKRITWTSPKVHKGQLVYANYFVKLVATLFDWVVLIVLARLFGKLGMPIIGTGEHNFIQDIMGALILYLLLTPIMESMPSQGTLGKILFGIKVVNKKGRRLNILHACLRTLIFSLSTAGFKATVWINLFTNDGRLLHDRLSASMVVKR